MHFADISLGRRKPALCWTDVLIAPAGIAVCAWALFFLNEPAIVGVGLTIAGMATALIGGTRLPLWSRILVTGVFLIQGFWWCLYERTMHVGLSFPVLLNMGAMFGFFALLPLLMAFRLWKKQTAICVVVGGAIFCLTGAATLAAVEESLFVAKHRETGAGLTSRWLMSGAGLWYDAESQRLYACD